MDYRCSDAVTRGYYPPVDIEDCTLQVLNGRQTLGGALLIKLLEDYFIAFRNRSGDGMIDNTVGLKKKGERGRRPPPPRDPRKEKNPDFTELNKQSMTQVSDQPRLPLYFIILTTLLQFFCVFSPCCKWERTSKFNMTPLERAPQGKRSIIKSFKYYVHIYM